eukprot:GDKI01041936.1.p1 GENE.GDKI01041936.1~~GDKI01041936.1.p1  ORF type:complete len:357 (+),score=89.42 GDKI01041936.1:44-1072(+)
MSQAGEEKKGKPQSAGMMAFKQQKLKAWQPVLTPFWVITTFTCVGTVFLIIGIALASSSNGIAECVVEYDGPEKWEDIKTPKTIDVTITADKCTGLGSGDTISGDLFLYYQLERFYQNHRNYVRSKSDAQLRGEVFTDSSDTYLSTCSAWLTDDDGKIYSPCGLIARSVFNDTYAMYQGEAANVKPETRVTIDDDAKTIAWESDRETKFHNPDTTDPKINQWLDPTIFPNKVENGHFIVWMRTAGLPTFRKLWGKVKATDDKLTLPVTVQVVNRYPVSQYGGTKSIVLSTTSWMGGRNPFLAGCYLVVGSLCLAFALAFLVRHCRNPRSLGDIHYLQWINNR